MPADQFISIEKALGREKYQRPVFTDPEKKKIIDEITEVLRGFEIGAEIKKSIVCPIGLVITAAVRTEDLRKIFSLVSEFEVATGYYIEMNLSKMSANEVFITVKAAERGILDLRSCLKTSVYKNSEEPLVVPVGLDYCGHYRYMDIARETNILITGTTGAGKTVLIDDILLSVLLRANPEEVKMLLVDPKKVELAPYNGVPHLLMPVVYDVDKALDALSWIEDEIGWRQRKLNEQHVNSIEAYNQKIRQQEGEKSESFGAGGHLEKLYRILLVVDEYKELMDRADKELQEIVVNIARNGRAAGIHLILATQVATAKVVTPEISSNMLCKIELTKMIGSQTAGGEKTDGKSSARKKRNASFNRLLGSGDLMFQSMENTERIHLQAPYIEFNDMEHALAVIKAGR